MKIVDTTPMRFKSRYWFGVPQPMYIYYGTEEFNTNVKDATLVTNVGELLTAFEKHGHEMTYNRIMPFNFTYKDNIWIKTVDKFLPEYAERDGTIFYRKENDELIPIDAGYVQLMGFLTTAMCFILYTSSGIHNVKFAKWDITAALRTQFIQEKDLRAGSKENTEAYYMKRLENTLNLRKPSIAYTKLAFTLMNPASPLFMDVDKSIKISFGTWVRQPDRQKILAAPAFRSALMQVFKTLFPGLPATLREKIPPEKIAEMLTTTFDTAAKKEEVTSMLSVITKVTELGYEETQAVTEQGNKLPMLPGADPKVLSGQEPVKIIGQGETEIEKKLTDEEHLDQVKKELDYPDLYIQDDQEEESSVTLDKEEHGKD
ncbi:MAG: hypothetical protein ACYC2U_04675 [Candidatus Amoebophilus sp.]